MARQFDLSTIRDRIVEKTTVRGRDILDHPHQWRDHTPAQAEALSALLQKVGIVGAILAYRSERAGGALVAIDGHLRKGLDPDREWPVLITDLTDEEADLVLATFDPLGAMARANQEVLAGLLEDLNVDSRPIQELLAQLGQETGVYTRQRAAADDPGEQTDRLAELGEKWKTEPGQLWEIPSATAEGQCHRLLCGDSTKAEDVERLMAGRRAVLFATDPPYLVDYDGTNHPRAWNKPAGKTNKDWSDTYQDWDESSQGRALYEGFVRQAVEIAIVPDAAWYCWHASRNQAMLEDVWRQFGAIVHQQIIWVKDRPVLTRSWYMWQHEPCLFGFLEGHQPCFFGWVEGQKPKRIDQEFKTTVWQFPSIKPGTSTDHPTSKPVGLFAIPMKTHTMPGDICYEPFAGSGSQLVAGEQLGRLVYAMEIAPEFVAVTLERLAGMGLAPRLT